ncbi:uncharacterized protein TRAVEDRAFT_48476 [Trametes versicolor FP-101664 SS1]|uniref:uncharacterized protein n=1 Tax=Trametes versicolor (strain FP-101664) TaxID=717944 RepID=UPI0004621537|nr:uncharacterized protein TRAVEDRAFT_48476 [Trametes versicolor FP-101664 SS1]EIW57437.1 hypothetical protein TRAVEDRAFT_48476 [Trametes versicolor FP-101664 SS1]
MAQLRVFLDLDTLHDNSRRYTVRHIRHRYLLWKRENVLQHLEPRYMSSIIRLLGSLSMSTPGKPFNSLHTHPRLPDMPESNYTPQWDMIIMLCQDKHRLRYPLWTSDRYWLMRARIAKFREHAETDRAGSEAWLSAAGQCYNAIRGTSSHPELHLSYLQALLVEPSDKRFQEFITHVASILTQTGWIHPSLSLLLFQSIVSDTNIPSTSKQELLLAISSRVAADWPTVTMSSNSPSAQATFVVSGAHKLVVALERAVFGNSLLPGATGDSLSRWARAVARRVFAVPHDIDHTDDLGWTCLCLLALVRTRTAEWSGDSAEASSDPIRRAAVMEWQTVCILAAVENLLDTGRSSPSDALPLEVVQGFCGVLRKLWGDWTAIPLEDAPPRPLYVSRLICASTLKLAGRLEDKVLLDACREYCVTARLWSCQESSSDTEAGLQELATEQLYAALKCGTFFERALVDLVVCTTDMGLLTAATDAAVMRYAGLDPEHAQELVAWARNRGIAPSGKAVAYVGIALARHGMSDYLDRYIDDPSLSFEQRAQVVMAHLRTFAAHGRRFIEPRAIADIGRIAVNLSTCVAEPGPLLGCLQSSLLVLIREGYAARAVALTEDVVQKHPPALTERLCSYVLSALLRYRRFKLARRLLARCAPLHPDRASDWSIMEVLRSARGNASRLASQLAATSAMKQPLRSAALTSSRVGRGRKLPIVSTLHLPSLYGATSDPDVALRALLALIRIGRLHAAKKLGERISQQESVEVRTVAGNMLLDGAATRASRGQRVRETAYIYRTLTEKHAFVPDRVTVNIMLKVLLSDKDLDVAKARTFFNAVVKMGYPTGVVPLGGAAPAVKTFPSLFVGDIEVPRVNSPVMYMRHVRPLYKTFVKAFYGVGDVDAARKVLGILKDLEAQNARRLVKGRDWDVAGGGRT